MPRKKTTSRTKCPVPLCLSKAFHWSRRDHAELLTTELRKARKRGPEAIRKLLGALDYDLRFTIEPSSGAAKGEVSSLRRAGESEDDALYGKVRKVR